jgi:ATPase family AAA domain-containing protein 2
MPKRGKTKLEEFDPTADDSEDLDWNEVAPSPRPKKSRSSQKPFKKSTKSKKSRRHHDSDVEDDLDDLSEEEWTQSSDEDQPEHVEINPNTGRRVRSSAKKIQTYEESDASAIEESVEEGVKEEVAEVVKPPRRLTRRTQRIKSSSSSARQRTKTATESPPLGPTRILTLQLPPKALARFPAGIKTRYSRPTRATSAASMVGTRRSSRLSHDPEGALMELSASGKHVQVVGRSTSREASAGPSTRRHTGGKGPAGKAPKKIPSAIIEESQEGSQIVAQDAPIADEVAESRVGSPAASEHAPEDTAVSDDNEAEDDIEIVDADDEMEVDDPEDADAPHDSGDPTQKVSDESERRHILVADVFQSQSGVHRSIESAQPGANNKRKRSNTESSDYNPDEVESEGESLASDDERRKKKPRMTSSDEPTDSTQNGRRASARNAGKRAENRRESGSEEVLDEQELQEEAADLQRSSKKPKRTRGDHHNQKDASPGRARRKTAGERPNYNLRAQYDETGQLIEDQEEQGTQGKKSKKTSDDNKNQFLNMQGPFGGWNRRGAIGDRPDVAAAQAVGGGDSDSSDDDEAAKAPTTARHGGGGAPANFGKFVPKAPLADVSPLGVDENITFADVGGLDDYVNKLKEMVILPLQYPELFRKLAIVPPRGVLFHGPPGNGKTLLARALASESTINGKQVTFFMRKGADVLNKYVGEAERQLRLLFEEAQKCQPAIIFFDEIDGLAPVRSSKQEQIHASIVASLLALMDGMDDRGQVVVIGATNRPDNVDPALRRPGRFDREFFIPLPNEAARRTILDIHTKKWEPQLDAAYKDHLAKITHGYSGADLRALCSEAALHAIQATYPQVYQSKRKLLADPDQIKVLPKDFIVTMRKIVPTSERSSSTAASGNKKRIEPLIRTQADEVLRLIDEIMPQKKQLTALQEALYDDRANPTDFEKVAMELEFDQARLHRPRLLISGMRGMGQQYLAKAVLQKLDAAHMQAFDLPTLLEDPTRSPESAIVALFNDVRRRKPAIIFIPNVDLWWQTLEPRVATTFTQMLRSLDTNDPVLLLGIVEKDQPNATPDPGMMRELFGFTSRSEYEIRRPHEQARNEFFEGLIAYIRKSPSELPDPDNRQLRQLPVLPPAPEEPIVEARAPTAEPDLDSNEQRLQDLAVINTLKLALDNIWEKMKKQYSGLQTWKPVFPNSVVRDLLPVDDDERIGSDLSPEQQAAMNPDWTYILAKDSHGVPGIIDRADGKFYYNIDPPSIYDRIYNGYYYRLKEFEKDWKHLWEDWKNREDEAKMRRAEVFYQFVKSECYLLSKSDIGLQSQQVYERCQSRIKKAREAAAQQANTSTTGQQNVPTNTTTTQVPPATPHGGNPGQSLSNGESVPSQHPATATSVAPALPSMAAHTGVAITVPAQRSERSQHTQRSALEKMAPGSSIMDYHNSASTTTSGQKTSDRSNRTSDRSQAHAFGETQSTNGSGPGRDFPDFSMVGALSGGSQIPDTQPNSGSAKAAVSFDSGADVFEVPSSQHNSSLPAFSQQANGMQFSVPSLPARALAAQHTPGTTTQHASDLHSVLNPPDSSQPRLILDEAALAKLHHELVTRSSGLGVEQLEQVMAALMDTVWRTRSKWNRNMVIVAVQEAFNNVVEDIENLQRVLDSSLEEEEKRRTAAMNMGYGFSH